MKFTDQTFENKTVELDGNEYTRCLFDRCTLVFSGAAIPTLDGCNFLDCKWTFRDSAQLTLLFLHALYHGGMEDVIEKTIGNIKASPTRPKA